MTRLFSFFAMPLVAFTLITSLSLWLLIRPSGFQRVVADSFALLPDPGPDSRRTPIVLRLLSVPMLCYSYTLGSASYAELLWLWKIFTTGYGAT